jgi:hypothetical protein
MDLDGGTDIETSDDEDGIARSRLGDGPCGVGMPLQVRMAGKTKPFSDGAGLCSPGIWEPAKRRDSSELGLALRLVIQQGLHQALPRDRWRTELCRTSTGNAKGPPFDSAAIDWTSQELTKVLDKFGIDGRATIDRPEDLIDYELAGRLALGYGIRTKGSWQSPTSRRPKGFA